MKKVISGKRYDTDTATKVAEWENMDDRMDFYWYSEELYRKSTGEYFLHGHGNARSKYAQSVGQREWAAGEKIEPLSYQAAQKWAERLTGDEYEAIFGTVDERPEKKTVAISISTGAAETLKRLAAKNGSSVSALIEALIKAEERREGIE